MLESLQRINEQIMSNVPIVLLDLQIKLHYISVMVQKQEANEIIN